MHAYSPPVPDLPNPGSARPAAVVYCEGNLGRIDGKTANGLVRSSERYRIVAVIDSTLAGSDAGVVLGGEAVGIPVVASLDEAFTVAGRTPGGMVPQPDRLDALLFGLAPLSGLMSDADRTVVLDAIAGGLDVISGMHEFLNDDLEISAAAGLAGTSLLDVRRPRATKDLRMFDGSIDEVDCVRIAVLGTDGAIGKRTTSTILTAALNEAGIHTVMIGTGQTGMMQGAAYAVALDAIPAQFGVGELEGAVVAAWEAEHPAVIIVEGQGALSHPAYLSSTVVLRASRPQGVIVQHAPSRVMLSDYPEVPMPTVESELALIETFGKTRVIGITVNHEDMTMAEVDAAAIVMEALLGVPAVDALWHEPEALVSMVTSAFPALLDRVAAASATA